METRLQTVLQSALSPRMPIVLQDEGYIRFRKGLGNYFLVEFAQKTKVALKKHTVPQKADSVLGRYSNLSLKLLLS